MFRATDARSAALRNVWCQSSLGAFDIVAVTGVIVAAANPYCETNRPNTCKDSKHAHQDKSGCHALYFSPPVITSVTTYIPGWKLLGAVSTHNLEGIARLLTHGIFRKPHKKSQKSLFTHKLTPNEGTHFPEVDAPFIYLLFGGE